MPSLETFITIYVDSTTIIFYEIYFIKERKGNFKQNNSLFVSNIEGFFVLW